MTLEERKALIDKKVQRDQEKETIKDLEQHQKRNALREKIRLLQPRIEDILALADYAKANGISLSGHQTFGCHEGYDTDTFISNGWSHVVGIKNSLYLGITNGGAWGNIDFYTNGFEAFGFNTSTREVVQPRISDLERFIAEFDQFESAFYNFIERICS